MQTRRYAGLPWCGQHIGLGQCFARKIEMTAILVACLWLIAANLAAIIPSKDNHGRRAYVLMATGAPLTVWLWWSQGWLVTLIFVACAASVLRWPVIYLWRWIIKTLQLRPK